MSTLVEYAASFSAGVLLGLFFLQGLWVTVKHLDKAPRPALRLLLSTVVRFAIVLGCFYFLARYAGWQHVITAVLGFSLLRFYVIRRLSSTKQRQKRGTDK
ncbi:MAG: ATP synthase subunit I [Gammaproteobacteria bacterium]|nr:ATP synthase subunit I [Gammaproteobacteria bacterium]MCW8839781.1 ATP synthase subunit I [Gammaproteobacteria bacterium]MCW8928063.1 ATP synthase subunit I [Gammaproteobacteria bacterium]MCW8957758.1 ATP synthase subunit I [Gammaproteobacteria bacterium]MCW8972496.1 ATP synthase subunit I [Gammaproteobacteria bacterium]